MPQFMNDVSLSASALTILFGITGTLVGAIIALWRANRQSVRAILMSKDAHIDAQKTIISDNTLALKQVSGTIGKLDEHLDNSRHESLEGAVRSREEHAKLMESMQKGQDQSLTRHDRLIDKLDALEKQNRKVGQ